ncbi:predicted protein [Nematostella vectensis]|uniref:Uncharacterized protein n=1 Tax=Nematostella vectensis TaxID=45351 RepID=A7RJ87_NEMVE|nr:predicted protein [Nematostella vectensis]|eukprot:XP_001640698.1 predicted protein [Nematostella vectensis]
MIVGKLHSNCSNSLRIFFSAVFLFIVYYKTADDISSRSSVTFPSLDSFIKDWCRIRRQRLDTKWILNVCNSDISWKGHVTGDEKTKLTTDASKSEISDFQLSPSGEFSRFFISTKTSDGVRKTFGGDSWRIRLLGPAAISPSVFDLGNGSYEVLFLVMEPGVYRVDIFLDYSLCDGYRDPPDNWFVLGNSQGKMQPDGSLGGHAKTDYLMQKFRDGERILINIPLSRGEGAHLLNALPELHPEIATGYDVTCGTNCLWAWDGYGRWIDEVWKPYLTPHQSKTPKPPKAPPKYSTLLIYGDSQADRMFKSIKNSSLCTSLFTSCKVRKMWVYPYTNELPPDDNLDFNPDVIIQDLREWLESEELNKKSVVLLNLGLHYAMDVSAATFTHLMDEVVKMIKSGRARNTIRARIIWKTTTALSKEKDLKEFLFIDRKRFLTVPRVQVFNPISTSRACAADLEVFDVFPLTRSYPQGTGGPDVEFYKEHDIVHFKYYLLKPLEDILQEYLQDQVPLPISIENYEFH